jgi:hypothetical protein
MWGSLAQELERDPAGFTPVRVAYKIPGIHWQFDTRAHAAEKMAGYNQDE